MKQDSRQNHAAAHPSWEVASYWTSQAPPIVHLQYQQGRQWPTWMTKEITNQCRQLRSLCYMKGIQQAAPWIYRQHTSAKQEMVSTDVIH